MFSDTWDDLYEYFSEYYSDQVLMYRADGSEQDRLCHKYSVSYFPYVIYIYPESECLLYTAYVGDRNYELVKEWMIEQASSHGLEVVDDTVDPVVSDDEDTTDEEDVDFDSEYEESDSTDAEDIIATEENW